MIFFVEKFVVPVTLGWGTLNNQPSIHHTPSRYLLGISIPFKWAPTGEAPPSFKGSRQFPHFPRWVFFHPFGLQVKGEGLTSNSSLHLVLGDLPTFRYSSCSWFAWDAKLYIGCEKIHGASKISFFVGSFFCGKFWNEKKVGTLHRRLDLFLMLDVFFFWGLPRN